VVFPDGPRVFRGRQSAQHASSDFERLAASRDIPSSTRKILAALPVGENNAWSSKTGAAGAQLAGGPVDVETTGTIAGNRPGRTRSRR
jgi:hypothetical protein